MLLVLNTGIDSADANMRFDEKLLEELKAPTLHLYQWARSSATYGYFIRPENHLDLEKTAQWNLDLARRPTGGGIVFHIWDLAFSFLMPSNHPHFSQNTLENYRFVNQIVLEVVKDFFGLKESIELIPTHGVDLGPDCQNFCMAKPTQYDVVYQGMKIAGSAQRKRKQGYLHQGTISLSAPQLDLLHEVLLSKEAVLEAMQSYAFAPLGLGKELQEARGFIEKSLADKLNQSLNS